MEKRVLNIGDVVQIDPAHDDRFGGCFMVITESKSWGAQGYCASPGQSGLAYYRCPFAAMELIGSAEWVNKIDVASAEEQGESPVTYANKQSVAQG